MENLQAYPTNSRFFLKCFFMIYFMLTAFSSLNADPKKTICVNMIVKNESEVIRQCLSSVKSIADYWVIVDTGSTDGTQEMIKNFMKDTPGELHERPWVNFAHNRNEALQLAKGKADYILFMDADDYLVMGNDFALPELNKDSYFLTIQDCGTKYARRQLIKSNLNWKWKGVLHEYLDLDSPSSHGHLENIVYQRTSDGARSQDPFKFYKDIQVLELALQEEPNNQRYRFYLAQSYKDVHHNKKAIENYKKRVELGGWDQEVFYSMLQIPILQEELDTPADQIIENYFKAHLYRPSRAEPLYHLASFFRKNEHYYAGYYAAELGLDIPPSSDYLFVADWIYNFGMLFEYSICAYWIGEYQKSENACLSLLGNPELPENFREAVEANLIWARSKLAKIP